MRMMRSTLVFAALLLHCVGDVVAISGSGLAGEASGGHGNWNTSTSATILKTIRSTKLITVSTSTEHVISTVAPIANGIAAHILHGLGMDTTSASSTSTSVEKSVVPSIPLSNSSSTSTLRGTGTAPTTLIATSATTNNRTLATTSMTGVGWATYRNQTFKSLCSSNDLACYSTCTNMVSACQSEREDWSSRSREHNSKVAFSLFGDSSYEVASTTTWTRSASTLYSYSLTYIKTTLVTEAGPYNEDNIRYNTTEVANPTCKTSGCADSEKSVETTDAYYQTSVYMTTEVISQPYVIGSSPPSFPYSVEPAVTRTYTQTGDFHTSFPEPPPSCTVSQYYNCSISADCNKCTITGGTVQLLYFPVSRTTSGQPQPTTTITTGPPITALYKNITMTDPSVYISFETAYAENECGTQVGGRYHGAILPLKPGELSSVYGLWGTSYTAVDDPLGVNIPQSTPFLRAGSFDLADLNWPVPASAYMNQPRFGLGKDTFSVIFDDYRPQLAVPPEIRSMDPAWESCALDWQGLYDPPLALKPADSIASVTMGVGSGPTSEPAKPGLSGNRNGPVQTLPPELSSTETAEQASSSATRASEQQDPKTSTSSGAAEATPLQPDRLSTGRDSSEPISTLGSTQTHESDAESTTSVADDPSLVPSSTTGIVPADPTTGFNADSSKTVQNSAGASKSQNDATSTANPAQSDNSNGAKGTDVASLPAFGEPGLTASLAQPNSQTPTTTSTPGGEAASSFEESSKVTSVSETQTATIVANDSGEAAIVVGSSTQAIGHLTTLKAGKTALIEIPTNTEALGEGATRQPAVTHTLSAFSSEGSQNAESILQAASSSAAAASATGDADAASSGYSNARPRPATTIGSHVVSLATESGEVAIDGIRLKLEGTTVQYGTFYSYGSAGIVVGETTIATSVIPATPAAWTGEGVTTDASQYSMTDGEGQPMSAIGIVQLNSRPATSLPSVVSAAAPVLTIGSQQYTQDPSSQFSIEGHTLRPGAEVTISGTTISLPASATHAVVDGITESFGRVSESHLPVLTVGSQQYTQDSSSYFEIDGQTLQPGAAITVSGTTLSLPVSATYVIVDGVTASFGYAASETTMPVFLVGSQEYTQDSSSRFVVGGQTLQRGSAITVSGTTLSLPTLGAYAVVDGVTKTLATANEISQSAAVTMRPSEGTSKEIGSEEPKATATSELSSSSSTATIASESSRPAQTSSSAGGDNETGGDPFLSGSRIYAVRSSSYLASALLFGIFSLIIF